MLLEEIGKPQSAVKKRDNLSSWSPPIVGIWNRSPILPHYPLSQTDGEKPYEKRDCDTCNVAAENTAINQLPALNHPATDASGKVGFNKTHVQRLKFAN